MVNKRELILASKSPRRKQLLSQLGVRAIVVEVDIDETQKNKELPLDYVTRVAQQKATAAFGLLNQHQHHRVQFSTSALILAADTCIVFEHRIIGKPRDEQHSGDILRLLSGNKHQVLSAVCLLEMENADKYRLSTRVNATEVEFKYLSDKEIRDYWHTGEPVDKAGSYAIQGLGAAFIKSIQGSYSAVMGLPLFETTELLSACGMNVLHSKD